MLDGKTEEEYRQIVNSFLDVNPFRRLSDFDVVIEGLSAILRTFPLREMPPHLSSYLAPIEELAQTPGKHPNPTHSTAFNNIVLELIRKKRDALKSLPENERCQIIAKARLAEISLAFKTAYNKSQELPEEAFSSAAPNLLDRLSAEQRQGLEEYQINLLCNRVIANLVRLEKLSLDTLLSLEEDTAHDLLQLPMLKLFFTGVINEDTFNDLSITQRTLLYEVKGVIYLIDRGIFTVPEALKLNPLQQANFGCNILVYCLINDLITIKEALDLDGSQIFAIDKHKVGIINGVISVSDVIDDPYQRKGPFPTNM